MPTIPLGSNIPGFYGCIGTSLSTDEAFFQLGRAVIWLKHGGSIPPYILAFLVDGFRRQVEGLERPGARGRFIDCVERGEPISPALRAEIVGWLRKQMDKDTDASGWLGGKAGRPPKAGESDVGWIKMWAWYCYHLDPQFALLPKSLIESGRAEAVGVYLHSGLVNYQAPLPGLSARNVMRYVEEFAHSGFQLIPEEMHPVEKRDIKEWNRTKARLFCVNWLGLSNGEPTPSPLVATEGELPPMDIEASWARQADHPRPAPAPSPADIEARRIVKSWTSARFAAKSKS